MSLPRGHQGGQQTLCVANCQCCLSHPHATPLLPNVTLLCHHAERILVRSALTVGGEGQAYSM